MKKMTLEQLDNHFTYCAKIKAVQALNEDLKTQKVTLRLNFVPDAESKCSPSTPTTAAPSVDNVTRVASRLWKKFKVAYTDDSHWCYFFISFSLKGRRACRIERKQFEQANADGLMDLEREILKCLGLS